MDQLCAHVILLPVKSMHTSPIRCSSQADKLALCTHKQTAHFPDIRDCFQSERQSLGSFTQKKRERERKENCASNLNAHTHKYMCVSMYTSIYIYYLCFLTIHLTPMIWLCLVL